MFFFYYISGVTKRSCCRRYLWPTGVAVTQRYVTQVMTWNTYSTLCIQTFLCISQGIMNHKEYSSHWCTSVERSVVLLQETNQRRCSVIHYDLSCSTGVFLVNTWRMARSSNITVHTLRKTNSKATSARHHVRQVSKAGFAIQLSETTFWES